MSLNKSTLVLKSLVVETVIIINAEELLRQMHVVHVVLSKWYKIHVKSIIAKIL